MGDAAVARQHDCLSQCTEAPPYQATFCSFFSHLAQTIVHEASSSKLWSLWTKLKVPSGVVLARCVSGDRRDASGL
jgi:hypothetical protein